MAASKSFALPILMLMYAAHVAAIQKTIGRSQAYDQQGSLCISIAAYEDPQWLHFLISNALRFTDCSTKVVLHLNNETNYTTEDMDELSRVSTRVSVNPERINVDFNRLSILHAHVLNAIHMERTWRGQCSYYVLQASNMLWIKPGVEPYVAEFRMSGSKQRAYLGCDGLCDQQRWATENRAWSVPEGTFVPMRLMNSFTRDYMGWYHTECDSGKDCLNEIGGKEEDWLQTYACLHNDNPLQLSASQIGISSQIGSPPTCARFGPTLCERYGPDKRLTVADVDEIIKAGSECETDPRAPFSSYYENHLEFCNRTSADLMAPFSVKVNSHGPGGPGTESPTHDPDGPLTRWLDLAKKTSTDPVISHIMKLTYETSPGLIGRSDC